MADVVETILRIRDESSKSLTQIAAEADKAAQELNEAQKNARLAREALRDLRSSADATEDQLKAARTEVRNTAKALGVARDRAKETRNEFRQTRKSAQEKAAAMKRLALSVTAAAASAVVLIKRVMDMRNELTDMSQRVGLSADTLAGFRLAAKGSGLELSSLEDVLKAFPKRMADFAAGTGEAQRAFKALGVSVTDENDNLRDADDVLRDTLASLQALPSDTERAARAAQLFGESGGRLLQALGGAEIDDFIAKADAFGTTVGPDAAKAASDWQRSVADLTEALDGATGKLADAFKGIFSGDVLDTITESIVFLGEFTSRFIENEIEKFNLLGGTIASVFTGDFDVAAELFRQGVDKLTGTVGFLVESFEEAKEAAKAATAEIKETGEAASGTATRFQRTVATPEGVADTDPARAQAEAIRRAEAVRRIQQRIRRLAFEDFIADLNEREQVQRLFDLRIFELQEQAGAKIRDLGAERADEAVAEAQLLGARLVEEERKLQEQLTMIDMRETEERIRIAEEEAAARLNARTQEIMRAAAIPGQIADPIGGIGQLAALGGPVGAGIFAGAQGLAALGQQGAAGVQDQLEGFTDAIIAGLEALPEILREVIPEFVTTLVTELVPAFIAGMFELQAAFFVELPIRIVEALIKAIPEFVRQLVVELPVAIAEALAEFIKGIIPGGRAGRTIGRVALGIATGGLSEVARLALPRAQSGAFVQRTGALIAHQGEVILNQAQQGNLLRGVGQSVNLNVGVMTAAEAADEIARVLEPRFDATFGLGQSPLFGGT